MRVPLVRGAAMLVAISLAASAHAVPFSFDARTVDSPATSVWLEVMLTRAISYDALASGFVLYNQQKWCFRRRPCL